MASTPTLTSSTQEPDDTAAQPVDDEPAHAESPDISEVPPRLEDPHREFKDFLVETIKPELLEMYRDFRRVQEQKRTLDRYSSFLKSQLNALHAKITAGYDKNKMWSEVMQVKTEMQELDAEYRALLKEVDGLDDDRLNWAETKAGGLRQLRELEE